MQTSITYYAFQNIMTYHNSDSGNISISFKKKYMTFFASIAVFICLLLTYDRKIPTETNNFTYFLNEAELIISASEPSELTFRWLLLLL